MNSNPKDRDRSLHEAMESRRADSAKSADTWSRTGARRKDADHSPSRDPDLPTHVVGEHQTD